MPDELGISEVALTKNLEKRPDDFNPTRGEWAADGNRQQVMVHMSSSGTQTLFTVPVGRVLYITSAYIAILDTSSANSGNHVSLEIGTARVKFLVCCSSSTTQVGQHGGSVGNIANNFPMPLRVEQGEIVRQVGGAISTETGFQGYLE